MREINAEGLQIIKDSEGLCLERYVCPGGYPTIGYGHRILDDEGFIKITEEQAEMLLKEDIEKVSKQLSVYCKDIPLNDNQWSALVSFVYNLGIVAFRASTLYAKLHRGDYIGAAREFPRWTHAAGKILTGLKKRREKEKELFLAG